MAPHLECRPEWGSRLEALHERQVDENAVIADGRESGREVSACDGDVAPVDPERRVLAGGSRVGADGCDD